MAAYNANDTGILLESGTNELELLEFNICGNSYGINIAKVREIMMEQELVPMPQAPAATTPTGARRRPPRRRKSPIRG